MRAVVTAHVDGRSATHPLDGPHGTAAELLSDLVDRARQDPVAVVQLAAEVLDGGDVRVAFASVGTEPVTFQVDAASLRVRVEVDGQWRDGRSTPPSRFSLVAPPDGISRPFAPRPRWLPAARRAVCWRWGSRPTGSG